MRHPHLGRFVQVVGPLRSVGFPFFVDLVQLLAHGIQLSDQLTMGLGIHFADLNLRGCDHLLDVVRKIGFVFDLLVKVSQGMKLRFVLVGLGLRERLE